jgi:hypothetical protein
MSKYTSDTKLSLSGVGTNVALSDTKIAMLDIKSYTVRQQSRYVGHQNCALRHQSYSSGHKSYVFRTIVALSGISVVVLFNKIDLPCIKVAPSDTKITPSGNKVASLGTKIMSLDTKIYMLGIVRNYWAFLNQNCIVGQKTCSRTPMLHPKQ